MKKIIFGLLALGSISAFAYDINSVEEFNQEATSCDQSYEINRQRADEFIESRAKSSVGFKVKSIEVVGCEDVLSAAPAISKVRVIYQHGRQKRQSVPVQRQPRQ